MFDFVPVMQGTDRATYVMGAIANAGTDFRPVWEKVHKIVNRGVRKQFSTQGAYMGQRWAPLSAAYAKQKRKRYGNKPIERRTDRMWQSLVNPNHDEHVYLPRPQSLEIGTVNPYAPIQHRGAPVNNLPARRLVGLTQTEIVGIFKEMQKHMVDDIGGFRRINL